MCNNSKEMRRKVDNNIKQQYIIEYSEFLGLTPVFHDSLISILKLFFSVNKNALNIIERPILYRMLRAFKKNVYQLKRFSEDAYNYAIIHQAFYNMTERGIPSYIFKRPDTLDDIGYYGKLAQERIRNKMNFPSMVANVKDNIGQLINIIGQRCSEEYLCNLQKIPQIVFKNGVYKHEDIKGELVNIINGQRIVKNSDFRKKRKLHFFGRCGAFGYAVEDAETIPSYLQKIFNDNDIDICIVNHGLWGGDDRIIVNNIAYLTNEISDNDIFVYYGTIPVENAVNSFQDAGAHFMSCTKVFHKFEKSKNCFYDRPGHMNHDGYKYISKVIYNKLMEENFECKGFVNNTIRPKLDYIGEHISNQDENEFDKKLKEYIKDIKLKYPTSYEDKHIGAIVMNCNPFTLGHRYLIEYASRKVDRLYVFILQEDKSFFKFADRIKLVRLGTSDLDKVLVIPSGEFMISALTFPEYFMKEYKQSKEFDATKDLSTFSLKIAPELNINVRFAGEEPIDIVTREYNDNMRVILPSYGIEFCEIPRKAVNDGDVISASKVRKLMKEDKWDEIKKYVPQTTLSFLYEKYKGTK